MRNKYLITGAGGFVGGYLWRALEASIEPVDVLGVDLHAANDLRRIVKLDLSDRSGVAKLVADFRPDYVIHLAASSSVAQSWKEPAHCFLNNTSAFLNLADAVRDYVPNCRILSVGSAEVYGGTNSAMNSFRENTTLRPGNPYAVGRLAQEQMSRIYVDGFGMNIIATRSFNHVGPGQSPRFAVASFIKQLADANRRGEKRVVLRTGNVDLVRDISDVRDVVRAYLLLLQKGKSGEIYNVGRGEGFSLRSIIETAANILGIDVEIAVDRSLLRPTDPQYLVGSIEKIHHETGWRPQIPMEQTLRDMLESFTAPNVIAR